MVLLGPGAAVAGEVAPVVVFAATPAGAADLPVDQLPAAAQVLEASDLSRTGPSSLLRGLSESVGRIAINSAQANPFQPNLTSRGFEASPLAGNPQGLAVYVDGVRFNQPFGDTVNWDLIPDGAVDRVAVAGADPVFGLNALGGSLDVRLKTGETFTGLGAEGSGGAFGRRDGFAEFGANVGGFNLYAAFRALEEDGWRDFSPSELRQAYLDLGWRGERLNLHAKVLAADNELTGNGASPVELLEVRRNAVFTHPDRTENRFQRFSLSADYQLADGFSLQAVAYHQRLRQRTANGDAAEAEECDDDDLEGFLCLENEDEPLTDADGAAVRDFLDGGTYAFLNSSRTRTRATGATLQGTWRGDLFGRPNRLVAGASRDDGRSRFAAGSELGALTEDRGYRGPGVMIEQEDGAIGSVSVHTRNRYDSLFLSNVLEATPELTLTLSGRYNRADVELRDQIGTALNGDHRFSRFNPAVGATYRLADGISLYGGYSEANRAPTPAELSCADPEAPCSLTNFFVGDPPLEQVVARTVEGGVRGQSSVSGSTVRWSAGLFRTRTRDDLMFTASEVLGRAYFRNIGRTRRQGAEADLSVHAGRTTLRAAYAFTDATFRSAVAFNAPENPLADEDGRILAEVGDEMPGVARHRFKLAAEHEIGPLSFGAALIASSGQRLFGDESNDNPRTGGYAVVNASVAYRVNGAVQLFVSAENLFDRRYETFGTFSPVDEVPIAEAPDISDPRSLSPAPPRSVYVGLRLRL